MKRLLTFSISLLCAVAISAQTLMKIEVKDAKELKTQNGYVTLPANVVKNITFETTKVDTTLTVTASNVTETSATIQLTLTPADLNVRSFVVEYGTEAEVLADAMRKASSSISSSISLSNLESSTTYFYFAYVELSNGIRIKSNSGQFTTLEKKLTVSIQFTEVTPSYTTASVKFYISGEQLEGGEYGLYCSDNYSLLEMDENLMPNTAALKGDAAYTYNLDNLTEGTTYYLKAFVKAPDGRIAEASKSFVTRQHITYTEPEAVDLGLSVKWASFNLGAASETEYGGYFGWGDPTGEETRNRNGYYAPGVLDRGIRGDVNYDIAAAKLGGHWRLPTPAEVLELQSCNPTYYTKDGVYGVLLTGIGSKSSNTIFIPCAGYGQVEERFLVGVRAYLWTDSINAAEQAYCVDFMPTNGILALTPTGKYNLATVRAVWDDGSGAEPKPEIPDPSKMAVEGSENNPITGAIPQDGVDMGGRVKWARWNVGCMTADGGTGRYYAWGATETQDSYTLADYASNPYYQVSGDDIVDGTISSDNDVAAQLWGSDWRLPTAGDFAELYLSCDIKWTEENGVLGYLFTSPKTGNSIFFPASGHKTGTSTMYSGDEGRYWTSSIFVIENETQKRESSTCFYFHNGLVEPRNVMFGRDQGLQIRPVKSK